MKIKKVIIVFILIILICVACATEATEVSEEPINYEYTVATEASGATSYIFGSKVKPKLSLKEDGSIADIKTVNVALAYLNLPKISVAVPERETITGQRYDRGVYYWENYPLGSLKIQRSLCRVGNSNKHYDCIWKITVSEE